jgi:hypothetical protein
MRRLGLALAAGLLMAGTSAYAQVTSVTGSSGTTVSFSSSTPSTTVLPGGATIATGAAGSTYNSFVDISPSLVTFESSNVGSGPFVNSTSFSTVNIGVHNPTNADVNFSSTITGAGLGFYLADTSTNCLFTGCAPIPPPTPGVPSPSFSDLPAPRGGSVNSAIVGFDFSVSLLSPLGSTTPLYHLDGSLILTTGSTGASVTNNLGDGGTTPSGVLKNFRLTTPEGSDSALGFAWDATPISFDVGAASDFTLVYTTTVFSTADSSCIPSGSGVCLVAYSGFGDPVGRGGGVDSFFSAALPGLGFLGANLSTLSTTTITDPGLSFEPAVFNTPTFVNGVLGFTAASVPEPATWMTMILGFGMLGATLRRRRTVAAI